MKPRFLLILEQALESGIAIGYARAYKHNDDPSGEAIKRSIHDCVMVELAEWFDFGDDQ